MRRGLLFAPEVLLHLALLDGSITYIIPCRCFKLKTQMNNYLVVLTIRRYVFGYWRIAAVSPGGR